MVSSGLLRRENLKSYNEGKFSNDSHENLGQGGTISEVNLGEVVPSTKRIKTLLLYTTLENRN
jgi:hypothetical protein